MARTRKPPPEDVFEPPPAVRISESSLPFRLTVTTQYLLRRMQFADKRWEAAMAHPGYRDEPTKDKPFTDAEWDRYKWADAWRDIFHRYEGDLYNQRDVRRGMCEGLVAREETVTYE